MKKIPTLFKREFQGSKVVNITNEVTPGMEWALEGLGDATEKWDGACCAVINGEFYKRYDAKKDKKGNLKLPPEGSIPCDDPDPVTGHWPHWVKVDPENPADRWFVAAYLNSLLNIGSLLSDATYEAVGPHFNNNSHNLSKDRLVRHGIDILDVKDRSFDGIRDYLSHHAIEGIVFWKDGEPKCKIKRRDFGFDWPVKNEK